MSQHKRKGDAYVKWTVGYGCQNVTINIPLFGLWKARNVITHHDMAAIVTDSYGELIMKKLKNNNGFGVIEIMLVLVVLIIFTMVFRSQIISVISGLSALIRSIL